MYQANSKSGYSLVEVMVGIGIFALLAGGIASSTALNSRLAISNIYRNTAYTVVQSYAEQIKSIDYVDIEAALLDPANVNIPTVSLSVGAGAVSQLSDPLRFGVRTEKSIIIDVEQNDDGTERERRMQLWVTPRGVNLKGTADDLSAIEITLDFEWLLSDRSITRTYVGSFKVVKTAVSEY